MVLLGYNLKIFIQWLGGRGGGLIFGGGAGDKNLVKLESSGGGTFLYDFWQRQRGSSFHPPSRERSAMPETKLGHKSQQNYNRLNYKMYYKSVIIHKNRIFPYFQNKVRKLNKYNNITIRNDNKFIIQYFWMWTPLPLRFCPPLHHPQIVPK